MLPAGFLVGGLPGSEEATLRAAAVAVVVAAATVGSRLAGAERADRNKGQWSVDKVVKAKRGTRVIPRGCSREGRS